MPEVVKDRRRYESRRRKEQAEQTRRDIVTAAAGTRINSASELRAVINAHRPGDTISVTYARGSTSHTVTVKLAARPA